MFAQAKDCLLPMGMTSEIVAERYGITRQEQDQAAVSFADVYFLILCGMHIFTLFIYFVLLPFALFRLNLIGGQLQQLLLANLRKKSFLLLQR